MKIETEFIENISGIPENANPIVLQEGTIDYSNKNNLEKINDLPVINITNINGDTCPENGQYIINAKVVEDKNNQLKNKYNNVEIRFSMPESSGLCEIIINDNVSMTCENKEKFDTSQILVERNVVQDQEGNDIFIINSFTNLEVFGCDISYNSTIIPEELDSKVWKINGPSKKQYSKTVSFLLERGIDNLALNENISFNNSMLEKIYARDGYCIDLIEQLYKELDMKAKLENFKKDRYKDNKYVK